VVVHPTIIITSAMAVCSAIIKNKKTSFTQIYQSLVSGAHSRAGMTVIAKITKLALQEYLYLSYHFVL
jgi:hypothetical protein